MEGLPINNKIDTIIFSRDRAMQLDAVLRSFFLHCQDAAYTHINVLYLATDERNVHQYESLIATYPGVIFIRQTNFQRDVNAILNPYRKGSLREKIYFLLCSIGRFGFIEGSLFEKVRRRSSVYIMRKIFAQQLSHLPDRTYILFLVDDNLFVRDFSLIDATILLEDNPDSLGVSLRLGRNTQYCYSKDSPQLLPCFSVLKEGWLKFNWTVSEHDFSYPLEVSSSIYRTKEVIPLITGLRFQNPNGLEGSMATHSSMFRSKFPTLICFEQSITFCNPVNIVQNTTDNRAGEQFHYTIDEMITRFDQGERICVEHYTDYIPNACHQELELIFERTRGNLS